MGQEFHVLRCFSCKIFQVQQVKKSRRWACKVCGEKQSLVKEFGRGGAVDCRRHVQKLNALRGRQQELSGETPGSQREQEDESGNEDVDEGLDEDQEVSQHISRWSKYTDPTAEGPDEDEDEEEEQNIYTERQRFRSQGARKRKQTSTLKPFAGSYDVCEDEEPPAGCSGMKRPYLQQDRRIGSAWNRGSASCGRSGDVDPYSSSDLPSSCQASTHTVESTGNKQQQSITRRSESPSVSSGQTSDSRWSKFLPVVCSQRDEDEDDPQAQLNDCSTEALEDCEEHRYPLEEEASAGVCLDGSLSYTTNTHSFKPSGSEHTVSEGSLLAKTACPKLSFNPMFLTDEDFDDWF